MTSTDARVLQLRKAIEQKVMELGEQPKVSYKTNLKVGNVNVLTLTLPQVVELLSEVLSKEAFLQHASSMIGVDLPKESSDMVDDLVMRGKVLLYKQRKDELDNLRKQLDDLRSESLKREDQLDVLESILGIK